MKHSVSALGGLSLVLLALVAGQRPALSQSAQPRPAGAVQAPTPSAAGFVLVDATVQLEAGASNGEDTLLLKVDRLSDEEMKAPLVSVDDIGGAAPPVRFDPDGVREVTSASGPSTRQWLLRARVDGLPPKGMTQTRYLTFSLGQRRETHPYTLTNASAASFAWTVRAPLTEVSLQPGQALEVGVAVGPVAATGVTLLQAQLAELTTKEPLPAPGLLLCQAADACDGKPFPLAANSGNRLWLRAQEDLPSGRYAGTITVSASEKPSGETFTLTVNATTTRHRVLGLIAVAFGVLLSFLACVLIPNLTNRKQAMLPATKLRDQLAPLTRMLLRPPSGYASADPAPKAKASIGTWMDDLSQAGLDRQRYLPRVLAGPWGGDPAPRTDDYKAFLQSAEIALSTLAVIVRDGVVQAWHRWDLQQRDAQQAIKDAVGRIDALIAVDGLAPAQARERVDAALTQLDAALAGLAGTPPQIGGFLGGGAPATFEQVNASITQLNALLWLVVAVLATITGFYTIVWSSPGFGLAGDYVKCVLWGFGLPTAGQQLLALTPASIRTTLSASVPKLT